MTALVRNPGRSRQGHGRDRLDAAQPRREFPVEQSRRKPTLAAYECVLRGIKHLRGYGPDDNRRAVELFQQAMDLDPDYALARAYRAFADVVLHGYGDAPDAFWRRLCR